MGVPEPVDSEHAPSEVTYSMERGNGNTLQQEMWRMEDGLKEDIRCLREDLRRDLSEYITRHDLARSEYRDWVAGQLAIAQRHRDEMDEAIQGVALDRARAQGYLGVARWVLDGLSRNWKALAILAAFLLTLGGNITITLR